MSQQNFSGNSNQPKDEQNKKNYTLHFFFKTGGAQPTLADAGAINHFFRGNYAKSWAIRWFFFQVQGV